jgi:peptidoglycan-associated lipoprotein
MQASTRITVNTPVAAATPSPTDEELFAQNVKDVFFDYDKYVIRPDEAPKVQNNEAFLAQHPSIKVLVEGHCDDRGSKEYNIAFGTSRADTVKRSLEQAGVPGDRIRTVSYGKEKPFCSETTNSAGRRIAQITSRSTANLLECCDVTREGTCRRAAQIPGRLFALVARRPRRVLSPPTGTRL